MGHKIWVYGINHMFWSEGAMNRGWLQFSRFGAGGVRRVTAGQHCTLSVQFLWRFPRSVDGVGLEMQVQIGLSPGPESLTSLLQTVTWENDILVMPAGLGLLNCLWWDMENLTQFPSIFKSVGFGGYGCGGVPTPFSSGRSSDFAPGLPRALP